MKRNGAGIFCIQETNGCVLLGLRMHGADLVDYCIGLRSPNIHASFTRDAVIYVFENALYVTERHERRGASCEA